MFLPENYKKYIIIIVVFLTGLVSLAGWLTHVKISSDRPITADKVIVLIIDDLGLNDLKNENLVNLNKIADYGAIGLMNTRIKSFGSQNRMAAYLTIGMGVRVSAPETFSKTANTDSKPWQTINKRKSFINTLKKLYPDHVPGKIGESANKAGKRIAVLGNSETDSTDNLTWLVAMDSNGTTDSGEVGSHLLKTDSEAAWSRRTDIKRLLNSCSKIVNVNDIVFVDFGDTTRVAEARERLYFNRYKLTEMRNRALERADLFLGELIKIANKHHAVLIVVSPTSPRDNDFSGIKNLAPVLVYKKGSDKGILKSNTTRRAGLISNIDIAPGIFAFMGIDTKNMDFSGEKITVVADTNPKDTIEKNLRNYISLKIFRYIVHGLYVLLILLFLYFVFLPVIKNRSVAHLRVGRAISVMITGVPGISIITAGLLEDLTVAVPVFLILLLAAGYLLSKSHSTSFSGVASLSGITAVLIIYDLLSGAGYLVRTPLGFNDVFTGGRYYGINNDTMGILLGSTVFSLLFLLQRLDLGRFNQLIITAGVMSLVVLSQTPGFGANVGGTIAAVVTGVLTGFILLSGRPPGTKGFISIVTAAMALELVISFMDMFSGNRTHAGKTAVKLFSGKFGSHLIEIIGSKLSVFLTMLVLPPWNIVFFIQMYLCYILNKRLKIEVKNIEKIYPLIFKSFKIIFFGAAATFIFNDTGIIAAAMMLIYLTVPLGLLLVREGCPLNEYRRTIAQRI